MFRIIFVLTLLIFACNSKNKTEKGNKIVASTDTSIEAEMKSIDEVVLSTGKTAISLKYSKENGASIQVYAHLTAAGKLLKIDENFNEGNDGNYGTNSFYLKDNNVIATKEYFEDKSNKDAVKFVERISYYDKKGEVVKTIEKRVNFEEELDGVGYVEVAKQKVAIERAQKALNQMDEFETTFQGFVSAQAIRYLVVGAKGQDAYTSAIRMDKEDDFIRFISQDEKKHLNRKVQISFEQIQDPSGFEYQLYVQGSFVN